MSSMFSGSVRGSICICARLSIWKTPVVSALRIARNVSASSSGIRERSIRSPRTRPISSTQRSTADSIPSPSRSIFRKPASAHESLSHCTIWRPSIAAGCTGQTSISGSVESTIPPGCWEAWRGRPQISAASRSSARQRPVAGAPARRSPRRCRARPPRRARRRSPSAPPARSRPAAAPAPCRGRAPRRATGRSRTRRPAPSAREP